MEGTKREIEAAATTATASRATDSVPSSPLSSLAGSVPSSPISPLSRLSQTPSLPNSPIMASDAARRYPSPSPTSTTASGAQSPAKQLSDPIEMRSDASRGDGPPPAKKRRMVAPKERTTEYLDLLKSHDELNDEDGRQMERLMSALQKKKKIVVIAGAGISVSAGIPDFRSSNGLFATARSQHKVKASGKHLFDASVYKHDSSTQAFHTMVREMAQMSQEAKPTPFHHMLASLAQEGRLLRLYSQNIDCLDTNMKPLATNIPLNPKGPWPATVQLHGGLERMVCTKCGEVQPFQGEVFDGPEAPLCQACVAQDEVRTAHAGKRSHGIGRLRPRFVLYNEYHPDQEAIGNVSSADLKTRPDAVIVVGTTLKVPGTRRLVKELCHVTRGRRDGFTAWINLESEPKGVELKDCWDLVVRSKCDNVARLVGLPPWDCNIGEDYLVSEEQDRENQERRSKTKFAVNLPTLVKTECDEEQLDAKLRVLQDMQQGIPTPGASPTIAAVKPVAKSKQSKLSFGKSADSVKTGLKAGSKRGRKPKKAVKEAPKATVKDLFRVQKNTHRHSTGKPGVDDTSSGGFSLRPERRKSEESFQYYAQESPDSIVIPIAPSTPTLTERPLSRDTISPESVPKGMGSLID